MGKVGDTMTYKSITVGFRICPVCKFYTKPFVRKIFAYYFPFLLKTATDVVSVSSSHYLKDATTLTNNELLGIKG